MRKYLARARRAGATVKKGSKHWKVYDADGLVAVIPFSPGGFEGKEDMKLYERAWSERGW